METDKPNYYGILPADVRYSKVSGNAKVLYSEISALSNKEGYCWASNSYFSNLYSVDTETISRWVQSLVKAGFIRYEIGLGNTRKIYLVNIHKNVVRYPQKSGEGIHKNVVHNTIGNTKTKKTAGASPALFGGKEEQKASWNLESALFKMEEKEGSYLDVIAAFIREKKMKPENSKQLSNIITRYVRIAKKIEGAYEAEAIFKAIDECKKESYRAGYEWTLETVFKKLTNK